jgi:hypothetical protein
MSMCTDTGDVQVIVYHIVSNTRVNILIFTHLTVE